MHECIMSNMHDLGINFHDKTHQQISINSLILTVENKLPRVAARAFKIQ